MLAAKEEYPWMSTGVETLASLPADILAAMIPGGKGVKMAAKYLPSMIHGAGVAAPGTGTRVQGGLLGGLGAKLGDFAGKLFTGKKADKELRDKAVDLIGWRLGQGKNLPETSPAWRPLNRDIGAAWNIAGEVGKKQPFPLTFTSLPHPRIHHNRMGFAAEELNQKIERSIKDRA